MRLNPDCIRDIVLYIEESSTVSSVFNSSDIHEVLSHYDPDIIDYHVFYLCEADYIKGLNRFLGGNYILRDLTPDGHRFAQDIHSDNIWEKTKSKANAIGAFSLDTLQQILVAVIASQISG